MFCSLYPQEETVGFEVNSQYRHLDSYKSTANVWTMTYRYNLLTNTRIAASLGLDNVKLFMDDDATDPMLKATIKYLHKWRHYKYYIIFM